MKRVIKIVMIFTCIFYQEQAFGYIKAQVDLFKKALTSNTQIANCANCDFRGTQDLAGVDAHGAHLPGINLQPCIQNDTNKDTVMVCIPEQIANLKGVNLANANIFSSCLDAADLSGADLSNADVSNSSLQYVNLKDAKLTGIVTNNATFCNAIMPDGTLCMESWTGQGVTIDCNCTDKDVPAPSVVTSPATPVNKTSASKSPVTTSAIADKAKQTSDISTISEIPMPKADVSIATTPAA